MTTSTIPVEITDMNHSDEPISSLKQWRLEQGLKLQDAGNLIGVADETWRRYEKHARAIDRDTMIKLCELTGLTANEIYGIPIIKPADCGQEARA